MRTSFGLSLGVEVGEDTLDVPHMSRRFAIASQPFVEQPGVVGSVVDGQIVSSLSAPFLLYSPTIPHRRAHT